jgi:predicted methyltransferase
MLSSKLFILSLAAAAAATLAANATVRAQQDHGDDQLRAAIDSRFRPADFRARDAERHPEATLRFLGLRDGQNVLELWPGIGWYGEILADYAQRTGGSFTMANYLPADTRPPAWFERMAVALQMRLDGDADRFEDTEMRGFKASLDQTIAPEPLEAIAEPASLDLVLSFRDVHAWLALGILDAQLRAAFEALRPGGQLGLVDHRAPDDWSLEHMVATGYVSEALVIARAESAGFVLEERADVNANPDDTRDYPAGVWTLPPALRLGDTDQDRYQTIGEPDRFTLRFRKP